MTVNALRTGIMDVVALWRRDMIRTARQPELATFSITMGIFFLLLFRYVFGDVIGAGAGIDYVSFLVPGTLVITALTGAVQTGTALAVDLTAGVNDRFRALPIARIAVIAGKTLADAVRNLLAILAVVIVGYLLGFRFENLPGAVGVVAVTLGIGYAFSWINAAIAATVRDPEAVNMLSMFWLFPLMFASNAFAPTAQMPPWLRAFADHQPIGVAADTARQLADGTATAPAILAVSGWIVALTIVFAVIAARSYERASQ